MEVGVGVGVGIKYVCPYEIWLTPRAYAMHHRKGGRRLGLGLGLGLGLRLGLGLGLGVPARCAIGRGVGTRGPTNFIGTYIR